MKQMKNSINFSSIKEFCNFIIFFFRIKIVLFLVILFIRFVFLRDVTGLQVTMTANFWLLAPY